jgi:hypothetical protein
MASTLKSALPSHLKPGNGDAEFARKHHGKTQSHMVSALIYVGSDANARQSLKAHLPRDGRYVRDFSEAREVA